VSRACGTHGRGEKIVKGFSGKARRKKPTEGPRRKRDGSIRMELTQISWGCMEWIHLAQERNVWRALVNTVVNLQVLAPST
jgi:hypothetical protein